MDDFWSKSLSSVNQFPNVFSNKDNYENVYQTENLPQSNGFNTLPSLKKKNTARVNDLFQNETFTAYFFSSAENLGCSTSNIENESSRQNENLPPRLFLTNVQPNTSRYVSANTSTPQNYSSKGLNDVSILDSSRQHPTTYVDENSVASNRHVQSVERNKSLVRKLFVNCSPTKQKPRTSMNTHLHSEKKENLVPNSRKISGKKLPKDPGHQTDPANENVITFHYRVGIPRSPNVQNFSNLAGKSHGPLNRADIAKDGNGSDSWSNEKMSDSPQADNQKLAKGVKYFVKDCELLQKHSTVMKEFNKNIDITKNLKQKNNKLDNRKNGGIENGAFQQAEEVSKEMKQLQSNSFEVRHGSLSLNSENYSPRIQDSRQRKASSSTIEPETNGDYRIPNLKANEIESDVYFGDVSNSSCYMSLKNDGPESLLYEEAMETRNLPKVLTKGHPLLNKQNLKMMENGNFNETILGYNAHSESKERNESSSYNRHHRHGRLDNQYLEHGSEGDPEMYCLLSSKTDVKPYESIGKGRKKSFTHEHHYESTDKMKYFPPVSVCGLQDTFIPPERHHESMTSNDEQSSSSLTADSGISFGRNFAAKCYENTYQEIENSPREAESRRNVEGPVNNTFETVKDNYQSFTSKLNSLNPLGDFAHPLFQKPKVLPRSSRYKEQEPHKKKLENSKLEAGLDVQHMKNRSFGTSKPKGQESEGEVSNQLLSTCNLTLSNRFLEEEESQLESLTQSEEEALDHKSEDGMKKSPKPLPRTSIASNSIGESNTEEKNFVKGSRYAQGKEKKNHFLAPDAQYEYQENFKPELKQKSQLRHIQNPNRGKPVVPARPLNLQGESKKTGKGENLPNICQNNESVCPIPRRRQPSAEDQEPKNIEINTHSVNV